ncbi:hypothetical protein SLEP1_g3303 [Rubroshorea leprosula]|uniref:Uncharacterized protein n=1 Tax=Rubroshorea leprosula TaxID=152421 RepID=A0AAV5HTP4_9ROSI|nr:hypothetical protein SLEP1_g3303 [Rubroshorea leprosula]
MPPKADGAEDGEYRDEDDDDVNKETGPEPTRYGD